MKLQKILLLSTLILFVQNQCFSFLKNQEEIKHTAEVGILLGTMNYTGDLAQFYNVKFHSPAATLFYKHNLANNTSVLRLNIAIGNIRADEKVINRPLEQNRGNSFNTNILELAGMYEYNFFNFRDYEGMYYMAPYLFGGLGVSVITTGGSPTFLTIPFGVGAKFKINRNINMGLEFGARKVFSDNLDGINDNVQYSSSMNQDWYYILGAHISYTWYNNICPPDVYGKKNRFGK